MPFFHSTVKLHVTRVLARMFEESTRSHGKLSEIRCLKNAQHEQAREKNVNYAPRQVWQCQSILFLFPLHG